MISFNPSQQRRPHPLHQSSSRTSFKEVAAELPQKRPRGTLKEETKTGEERKDGVKRVQVLLCKILNYFLTLRMLGSLRRRLKASCASRLRLKSQNKRLLRSFLSASLLKFKLIQTTWKLRKLEGKELPNNALSKTRSTAIIESLNLFMLRLNKKFKK